MYSTLLQRINTCRADVLMDIGAGDGVHHVKAAIDFMLAHTGLGG